MLDIKTILDFIYDSVDLAEAYAALNPVDRHNYYIVTCPECEKREAYVSKGKKYIACNRRNNCKYFSTLWEYTKQSKNLSNQETLFELARLAHYELPETKYSSEDIQKHQDKVSVLEASMQLFQQLLHEQDPNTSEIKLYLQKRGYLDCIEKMELGYFPGAATTLDYLEKKGYTKEAIRKNIKFLESREQYKLVFPYRTPGGTIKAIWGRSIETTAKNERKYLPFTDTEKSTLFNMHQVRGCSTVVIVEGYLDALFATAQGGKGIVALGGANLTKDQIETALRYNIENFILALDNDASGEEGTERAIKNLLSRHFKVYVVHLPNKYKDPDEMIREEGIEAFNNVIKYATPGAKWLVQNIITTQYDLKNDKSKRDYLSAIIKFESTLFNPLDSKDVIDYTVEALGIAPEMLEQTLQSYHEKNTYEKLGKSYKKLLHEAHAKLQRGEITDLGEYLKEQVKNLQMTFHKTLAKPKHSFSTRMETQFQEEENHAEGLLGYNLKVFRGISNSIDGLQAGFYIIAADTNIGKTAYITNLFLDVIYTNPGSKGIYFSLDDSYKVITTRFRGIMTRIPLNQIRRKLYGSAQESKMRVQKQLIALAREERLMVKDLSEVQHIEDMELIIREKGNDNLFVCIDGLHNLQVVSKSGGLREENIERANKLKALVDTYNIPIITTAEIRKRARGEAADRTPTVHDLMESSKFAYNANLVWMLYPENTDFQGKDEITLVLDYAKNKLSHFKGKMLLKFYRKQGRMVEVSE